METRRPTVPAAEEILGGYFPALDPGFVALVDYMGSDEDVERAARVSYGYGTRKVSATRGLIRYLRRHRHTTPSEMVEFKFHCAMPMFVARQWIRHRTASVNEYSGRYSLMPLLYYTPEAGDFALQSQANNQGRTDEQAAGEIYAEATARELPGHHEATDPHEAAVQAHRNARHSTELHHISGGEGLRSRPGRERLGDASHHADPLDDLEELLPARLVLAHNGRGGEDRCHLT